MFDPLGHGVLGQKICLTLLNMEFWDNRPKTNTRPSPRPKQPVGWLVVGCFGFNGPLRQYFSLYRAVSQREGERGEKGWLRVKMSKQTPPAPTASAVGPCPTVIQIVGCPDTGSLPSTIAPPNRPQNSPSGTNNMRPVDQSIGTPTECPSSVFYGWDKKFFDPLGHGVLGQPAENQHPPFAASKTARLGPIIWGPPHPWRAPYIGPLSPIYAKRASL